MATKRKVLVRLGENRRLLHRWLANAVLAWKMMTHDRPKLVGSLLGVVFSVVLVIQQLSTLAGLVGKNTMFVEYAGADVWIVPRGTSTLQASEVLRRPIVDRARSVAGVEEAQPLLFLTAAMQRPEGGTEPMSLVGFVAPSRLGAPWNLIAGSVDDLTRPASLVVDDTARQKLGNVNLGSLREVNGRQVRVVGMTWGLQPFAPAYAFADLELARRLTGTPADEYQFVLVRCRAGESSQVIAERLRPVVGNADVLTREQFRGRIIRSLLLDSALGISFGFTATFGLLVGFVIVALTMYSAVLDNLRELGTLKAIGCRNADVAMLILVQASLYATLGSFLGMGLGASLVMGARSQELALVAPPALFAAVPPLMLVVCVAASSLALLRIRKLEPGMVFR